MSQSDTLALQPPLPYEEFVNWTTHAFGFVLAVAAGATVVVFAAFHGTAAAVVGCCVYAASLAFIYAASTAYHVSVDPATKQFFHVVDRCGIYLLISGTYLPFTLGPLYGAAGFTISGVVWGITAVGIVKEIILPTRYRSLSVALYLAQGWLGLSAFPLLMGAMPNDGIFWLFAGGISYTLGVVFFAWERLPYNHAVWHLFVLGGSAAHFLAVLSSLGFSTGLLSR